MSDLAELIVKDLGEPVEMQGSRSYWLCPFHADRNTPSLTVVPDGNRFKCFGCGKSGGAVVWLMEQRGLAELEAYEEAERLGLADGWDVARTLLKTVKAKPRRRKIEPKQRRAPVAQGVAPPPDVWRERVRLFLDYCADQLYLPAGRIGLDHLHGRGLTDDTIKLWGLGWHEKDRWRDPGQFGLTGKKVWLPRGIIIPWTGGDGIWHVKARRFCKDGPKYVRIRGGQPTLYGLDFLIGKRVVVICEGELDAVLLWQEAGDLVDVVALGSKGAKPPLTYLVHLAGASRWLVALDQDADRSAEWWGDLTPRVRRVRSLQGNDLTDFHQAGGDLRAWVQYYMEKLNVPSGQVRRELAGKGGDRDQTRQSEAQGVTSPEVWSQAEAILAEMNVGDPAAAWAYAELAQAQGWSCWAVSWEQWARDASAQPLAQRVGDGVFQEQLF